MLRGAHERHLVQGRQPGIRHTCHQRGCRERRKSFRGDRMEAELEALLRNLRATRELFAAGYAMLSDLWDERMGSTRRRAKDAKAEIARLEHQSAQLMERVTQAGLFADKTTDAREGCLRTAILALPFMALAIPNSPEWLLVGPAGFEPATTPL